MIIAKERPFVYFEYPFFMIDFQNRWIFRICNLLGIRTILDVHDTIDQAEAISDGKWALNQRIEEYLFTNASLISFSLSPSMWDEIRTRYNISADKKIVFVPNAFEESLMELFQYPYKSVRGRFNIMYVGGLSKNRGIDLLVQACSRLHGKYNCIKLYLFGNYGFGVSDDIKNIIETSDFIEKKFVLRKDIPHELRNADLLVMPYNPHEMYMSRITPMKFFEYIGTGIPILSTKCESLSEIMVQGDIISVDYDVKDFERKIEQLINDPELRNRMSINLMRIRHLHTWEERARRLNEAIESLARPD
jgi:glycosyltransferase involved in cell wall biosynthesis